MEFYSKQINIKTIIVTKQLLTDLEFYFENEIEKILAWKKEFYKNQPILKTKSFHFYDSHGEEKITSINDFKYPYFRNDTNAVSINYNYIVEDQILKIILRFGKQEENSDLSVTISDESARNKTIAIENGLFEILERYNTYNYIFFPPTIIIIILIAGILFFGIITISSEYTYNKRLGAGLFTIIMIFYIGIIPKIKTYCTFETIKQKHIDKWFNWLLMGLASFILFSTILSFFKKQLFGI